MKLIPVTVTFGAQTLTEDPHGISGLSVNGQAVVDAVSLIHALAISTSNKGNDACTIGFTTRRKFASVAAGAVFALTHFGATGRRANLTFAFAGATVRMTGAALQGIATGGDIASGVCTPTYSFIGPPPAVVP